MSLNLKSSTRLRMALAVASLVASSSAFAQSSPSYQMRVYSKGLRAAVETPTGPETPAPAARLEIYGADGAPLSSLEFPDTSVGSNSAPVTVTLKNTGNAELTFNEPAVAVAAPFSVSDNTCANTLAPAASCTVKVRFSPTAPQMFSGALTPDSSIAPVSLPLFGLGTLVGVQQVVMGPSHTFVKKTDGSWAATGHNANGQLGLGDLTNRSSFTAVPALFNAQQVVAGAGHTFAQLADGTWLGAGRNWDGELGLGADRGARATFTPIAALNGATQVVAGFYHSFAKLVDGTWVATGVNTQGQLGLGHWNNRTTFTPVPALNGATQIVVGDEFTFARLASGQWAVAGDNGYGQLGLNDYSDKPGFTPVPALNGALQVVAGGTHAFAQLPGDTWVATGRNNYSQLGLGDLTDRRAFTVVPSLAGAATVIAGGMHTFAKLANGAWGASGYNSFGQLGFGDVITLRHGFIVVPALQGATQVVARDNGSFANMADGSWAAAGGNHYGQLGIGSTATHSSSFTPIPRP